MTYNRPHLRVSNYKDLSSWQDKTTYRALEIFPGAFSWATLGAMIYFSWAKPVWIALFIIVFDVYWLIKVSYLSAHLVATYRRLKKHLGINWREKLESGVATWSSDLQVAISGKNRRLKPATPSWRDIYHLIILPMYKEPPEVLKSTLEALVTSDYPKDKILVVLATEERAGDAVQETAEQIKKQYGDKFYHLLITRHPKNIVGEMAGKGSNVTWAAKQIKCKFIDSQGIPQEFIIVSVFDADTCVHPQYFGCLTYHFLTSENPTKKSYQPIPMYHNNLWDAPAPFRVIATSNTFWQMMEQQRSERLVTFSSHSMSFKTACDVGFWQTNIVSEDSRIFWQCLLHYSGDYKVQPLHFPVSMDTCLATSFWKTLKNQYKQLRRWAWGAAENLPYTIFGFLKDKKIPLKKRIYQTFNIIEGNHSWATNALIICFFGWLPLLLGGERFNVTVLAYSLPKIVQILASFALIGLVISMVISTLLLPPKPKKYKSRRKITMVLQWLLVPPLTIFFGSFPALEAQTRLMLGKYMGFWVTEKTRK